MWLICFVRPLEEMRTYFPVEKSSPFQNNRGTYNIFLSKWEPARHTVDGCEFQIPHHFHAMLETIVCLVFTGGSTEKKGVSQMKQPATYLERSQPTRTPSHPDHTFHRLLALAAPSQRSFLGSCEECHLANQAWGRGTAQACGPLPSLVGIPATERWSLVDI